MIWTEEQDQTLIALRAEGLPNAEIASRLVITRKSVTGRVSTLKLPLRDAQFSANIRWGKKEDRKSLKPVAYRKGVVTGPRFFAVVEAPDAVPVGLMERTGCAYPVTERGPHLFCNAACEGSYCEFHRQVMYKRVAA